MDNHSLRHKAVHDITLPYSHPLEMLTVTHACCSGVQFQQVVFSNKGKVVPVL